MDLVGTAGCEPGSETRSLEPAPCGRVWWSLAGWMELLHPAGHPVVSACPVGAALRCCSQGVLRHTHCASDSWSTQSSVIVLTLHITSASFTALFLTALCLLICFSHIRLSVTPWSIACQAPLPMKISRQEYWNGLPFPTADLPDLGRTCVSYVSCVGRWVLYH